ncbi:hypothetical protein [Granulicella arctica]|uniref:hypothetical protein n=1 Tax=Granulicella arctica TaxID=940613 RepID=UPI0021DFF9BF|nr:hypothetical protein [Granulicella arctica]
MLLSIQFPFADFRRFLHASTGCISQPGWPSPVIHIEDESKKNQPFVRGFGEVEKREDGGLSFWGEDIICNAQHAIKWERQDTYTAGNGHSPLQFEVAFRRFLSDGTTAGKCELGIATVGRPNLQLDLTQVAGISQWFLGHGVTVPVYGGESKAIRRQRTALRDISLPLKRHLLRATTRSRWMQQQPVQDWWIGSGLPMLFLQLQAPNESIDFDEFPNSQIQLPALGVTLSCQIISSNGLDIPLWILRTEAKFNRTWTRQLRLSLLRRHAAHESLRLVLGNLNSGRIKVKRDTIPTSLLQDYLEEANANLARTQINLQHMFQPSTPQDPDIAAIAMAASEQIWPGEMESLKALIRQMNLRKNIGIDLKRYTANQALTIGALTMNSITGSTIGNVIQGHDIHDVQQTVGAPATPIDLDALKKQLEALTKELSEALAKLPPERAEDKEAVADKAAELKALAEKETPNKKSLNITASGMMEAAKGIASVVPIALKISGLVASFIAGV